MDETQEKASPAVTIKASTRLAVGALRTRWLVRMPIAVFRARLGWVFGGRLLLLEHYGRKTGRRRFVVLEIVKHETGVYYVVSGMGEHSDWAKNTRANPRVAIMVRGRRAAPAIARRVEAPKAIAVLSDYAQRYPRAWNELAPVLEALNGRPISTLTDVVVVSFTLTDLAV